MLVALGAHQSPLKMSEFPNSLMPESSLDGYVQDVVEQVDRDVIDTHVDELGLHLANSERDLTRHYRSDNNGADRSKCRGGQDVRT